MQLGYSYLVLLKKEALLIINFFWRFIKTKKNKLHPILDLISNDTNLF